MLNLSDSRYFCSCVADSLDIYTTLYLIGISKSLVWVPGWRTFLCLAMARGVTMHYLYLNNYCSVKIFILFMEGNFEQIYMHLRGLL